MPDATQLDATQLVANAARGAVRDIVERYDKYHAHLVHQFVKVLRIQHFEPGDKAQRRAIIEVVTSFADEVSARSEDSA